MLLSLNRDQPLGEQIYELLRHAILRGELTPAHRLPTSRRLAEKNSVARNTVVAVYDRLRAEGYIVTRGTAGTWVTEDLPPRLVQRHRTSTERSESRRADAAESTGKTERPRGRARRVRPHGEGRRLEKYGQVYHSSVEPGRPARRYDFQYNASVADATSRLEWGRMLRRVMAELEANPPDYELHQAPTALHHALVRHLRMTRGVRCEPEQVVLLPSPQAAIGAVVRLLLEPGDIAVLEDPHFIGMRSALQARGAKVYTVPVNAGGLVIEKMPDRSDVRLVLTMPAHHWPTGEGQSPGRRLELLRWAAARGAWILEYDHNCEYLYRGAPVEAVHALDPDERVIYLGTLDRAFQPVPGMVYAVVPTDLLGAFRAMKAQHGLNTPVIQREALARYLDEGCLERQIRRAVRRLRGRQALLVEALTKLNRSDLQFRPRAAGIHLHVTLDGWSQDEVVALMAAAEDRDVRVYSDHEFHLRPPESPGIILGYAQIAEEDLAEGVRRLGEALEAVRPAP